VFCSDNFTIGKVVGGWLVFVAPAILIQATIYRKVTMKYPEQVREIGQFTASQHQIKHDEVR
jgi:hypothetical protein